MRFLKVFLPLLMSSLCLAESPADRLTGPIDSGQLVALKGNIHGMAKPQFDRGRLDGQKQLLGVSLVFKPSPVQQAALDGLLAEQQDPASANYHKWLTPSEFADRFGMSRNDIEKVISWLQSQGLNVGRVANSRNEVFFGGTVAQVESLFHTEIHNYLVHGELHFANASDPLLPAALADSTLAVRNLHNFQPRSRARVSREQPHPNLTSFVSGKHFLTPSDFATIYDIQGLYTAGMDGSGQKIAIVGQSAISLADVHNFRSAAGLPVKDPTLLLEPGTGKSKVCPGDESESDLDVEWAGGVARNATITLVYVGLASGDTCTASSSNRQFGAFDALQYAIDQNIAPIISSSYGLCENTNSAVGLTQADAGAIQGWAKLANSLGQTVVSATGDTGAADCDFNASVATKGLAVDVPASIPEVTGVGGTTFKGDADGTLSGTAPNTNAGATHYWGATTGSVDNVDSALIYIPESAWNDTTAGGSLLASGGGASIYFPKPIWQNSVGMPADGKRDVPDVAMNASPAHDGYLICSEDGPNGTIIATCTNGFRDAPGGSFDVIGGTSAGAPTFSAILALINQSLGHTPPAGMGNVNPMLYQLAESNHNPFHDITSGNNIVPCTPGSANTGCPTTGTAQFGFVAGAGYDQVTGLGSIKANAASQALLMPRFALQPQSAVLTAVAGQAATTTIAVIASGGFNAALTFTCTDSAPQSTCTVSPSGATTTTPVTVTVTTMGATAELKFPLHRHEGGVFFAMLLPGLLGGVFVAGRRNPSSSATRMLSMMILLAFGTLWLGACGGGSSSTGGNKISGTPAGTYSIQVKASDGGSPGTSAYTKINLVVQ